ncbi:MAG: Gfo/Idh/MocA family oxidoreductase [archaeon YNP-LCB-003-016]|jgi:UDP-N-acetylglucosamine 3-dehydrogenase|uniref:Gfo/Idh/MocA family protein n=1 Tax=Candidatus Culexarchaeum yellowstonense TaxID=2928963 RepID=UPI0026EE3262|nr:Gfo/Idh/MocA family oxidoreductase [Candidatus Culexarchaeum yellowstonense]MCC6017705.1 Gfo/Idh/MocA family oxidoreductase [Candidatus Verstraetearchaeota archaeon]MCR6691663.1 Gfo/Idh/MocA family oxidoreductase [Candidatus Culexarchaeum yellowstonense]
MDKVGVAVIGCGAWGRNHLRVLSELKGAKLVAASDINQEVLRMVKEKYEIQVYTDYHEMLKDKEIEAVTICTPSSTHAKIALDVIEAGKNLLVEKPMTITVEEAKTIIERANERKVKLMVGHIERYNPAVQRVKKMIDEGRIGEIVLISSKRVSRWPERVGDVGVVRDLAIHDLDLMRYITGAEPTEIYAVTGSLKHKYEDHANIILKFNSNPTGIIEANWITPKKIRELTVTGSEGRIVADYITQEIRIENSNGVYIPNTQYEEPLKRELENFINVVLGIEEPIATGMDGLIAVYLCELTLKSSKTGQPIKVEGIWNK